MADEQLTNLLQELIREQDTVTDRNRKAAMMGDCDHRHALLVEMREAQARRAAIRAIIMEGFERVQGQRDDLLDVIKRLAPVVADPSRYGPDQRTQRWQEAQAAIARAKGESCST